MPPEIPNSASYALVQVAIQVATAIWIGYLGVKLSRWYFSRVDGWANSFNAFIRKVLGKGDTGAR